MLTVAYLANRFPAAVEPYVGEEIQELRQRGARVVPGSVRNAPASHEQPSPADIIGLQPVRPVILLRGLWLACRRWKHVAGFLQEILFHGNESPQRRLKALLHTCMGAYYAVQLQDREVAHIHVHHGYFGSWIAMVAARLLGVSFSLTLHGSDLLLGGAYLDTKLKHCRFCVTVSEYNRRYILEHFPYIDGEKIIVSRLGVDVPEHVPEPPNLRSFVRKPRHPLTMLAVGRLHAVKDHAFLVRACARLRDSGVDFDCAIAGDGPERRHLELLIRENHLRSQVRLLGHIGPQEIDSLYRRADVVVLTSRSEGIPLVLMEAMARGKIVLAPAITGVPEIVIPGRTGFLYSPGDLNDFVARILFLRDLMDGEDHDAFSRLDWIRYAARLHVLHNFNRRKNLSRFSDRFLQRIAPQDFPTQNWSPQNEDLVLQQI